MREDEAVMSAELLKRGDHVTLIGFGPAVVERAGQAGFTVAERMTVFRWTDRGKTWASEKLDRQDATREQFKQAARSGGRSGR